MLCELRANLKRTGLRQRVDRRMLVQVHAALFSNVWLHDYDCAGPGLTGQDWSLCAECSQGWRSRLDTAITEGAVRLQIDHCFLLEAAHCDCDSTMLALRLVSSGTLL